MDKEPVLKNISRRHFLRGALLAVPAAAALAAPRRALAAGIDSRSVNLVNTHTGEALDATYYRAGEYSAASLGELNWLLRDFRTGDVMTIDRELFDLLHDVALLADREPNFEVISGYRSPRTNAMLHATSSGVALHSMHTLGRAIDVRLPGLPTRRLRDLALSLKAGGVGYYRRSDFVHIDTGRVRTWAG